MASRTRLAIVAVVILLVLTTMGLRLIGDGRRHLEQAEVALARHDTTLAIEYARRSAESYLPGAHHVAQAYAMLSRISVDCEARRDYACALRGWRAVRSAALGTRCVWLPSRPERAAAEAAIARLIGVGVDPAVGGRPGPSDLGESQRTWLGTDPPPRRAPILIRCAVLAALLLVFVWSVRSTTQRVAAGSGGGGTAPSATPVASGVEAGTQGGKGRLKDTRLVAWSVFLACAWVVSFLLDRPG